MFSESKDLIAKVGNTQKFVKSCMFRDKFARRKHLNGFRCHKSFTTKAACMDFIVAELIAEISF